MATPSRISSFYPIKLLPSLAFLDSAFQLQEYIHSASISVESIVAIPRGAKGKWREAEVTTQMPGARPLAPMGMTALWKHYCAIDYTMHTLDSATALLNSPTG
ncbi:hypothetical protein C8R46DRAFT_1358137 [Mycena filopes]|nr:hypothetical protein C8R46DRAFT_1358137 [Mycena filopes]